MISRISSLQRSAAHWTERVVDKTLPGLVLFGPPGVGKTHSILAQLRCSKTKFYRVKGHITPLQLYLRLYEHRNEIVVIDDTEQILKSDRAVSILRAALESDDSDGRAGRPVTYDTSQDIGVPSVFLFSGGVIYVGNRLPRQADDTVKGVTDRTKVIRFTVTAQDVFNFLREVMITKRGFKLYYGPRQKTVTVPREDCLRVADEMERLGVANLREFPRALVAWLDFRDDADRFEFELQCIAETSATSEPMTVESQKMRASRVFRELYAEEGLSWTEKARAFTDRTAMSPATFWRRKKQLESGYSAPPNHAS